MPETVTVQEPEPAKSEPQVSTAAADEPVAVEAPAPKSEPAEPEPPKAREFGWTAKTTELRTLRRIAAALVDEAKVHVEENGLRIRVVDPAHVCLMEAKMACPTTGEGQFIIRVPDWSFLEKAVGPALTKVTQDGSTDHAIFTLPAEGHTVKVRHQGPLNDHEPAVPNLNYSATILVPAARLKRLCAMAKGGQILRVEVDADVATLRVDEETGVRSSGRRRSRSPSPSKARAVPETTLRISEKETPGYIVRCDGPTKSLFSLDYIHAIVSVAHKDALLTIDLNTDFPVRIRWSDGPTQVMFLMAPRIESE